MSHSTLFNLSKASTFIGLALMAQTYTVQAAPFDSCPSKAYLFQSKPVQVYGVNLVTGQSSLLQGDTGTDANINGVGFDFDSRYIYGYDTTNKKIVRLGQDFQVEDIYTSGLPTDHTFYVGDVFNKTYYLYRKNKGLFKIDLTPLDSDPQAVLEVVKISSQASVNLTDFAFHPGNNNLYGVDNKTGMLYQFDPDNGNTTVIGDTGVTGTFGAGYFDVNGNLYLSRNNDGFIFRINLGSQDDIDNGNVSAVKFAEGPSSGQNDGARCANAPLIDEDSTIDFGDAPDSYLTTLNNNGPRHQIDGTYLGTQAPDGEQDGLISPLSDDTVGTDDEDGINFVTAIEPGLDSVIRVNASRSGYLTAWFDWNQDGDFDDEGEHVIQDQLIDAGEQSIVFNVDYNAEPGMTWSRFRFSQQQGLDYFGGATSGEVEDHPVTVTAEGITVRHFPSENGYATLAYEDNWPYTADYDMNDVVMHYRISEILRDGNVERAYIKGRLGATGADYKNGFAVRLQGVQRDEIDQDKTRQFHNDVQLEDSGLELDSNEAIFIVSPNLTALKTGNCAYHRTQLDCKEDELFMFELHVSIDQGTDTSNMLGMPYDPFIFATPGYYHGEGLPLHPGRQWEVHLPDYAPTEKFNQDALWNLGVDASSPDEGIYFKTAENLPWALLITEEWHWPTERTDLVQAYPLFAEFAESAGGQATNWHELSNAVNGNIYE